MAQRGGPLIQSRGSKCLQVRPKAAASYSYRLCLKLAARPLSASSPPPPPNTSGRKQTPAAAQVLLSPLFPSRPRPPNLSIRGALGAASAPRCISRRPGSIAATWAESGGAEKSDPPPREPAAPRAARSSLQTPFLSVAKHRRYLATALGSAVAIATLW